MATSDARLDEMMTMLADMFDGLPITHITHCIPQKSLTCNDEGRVMRATGMVEACERCRCHELAWAPYYAELLRIWLAKHPRKEERC